MAIGSKLQLFARDKPAEQPEKASYVPDVETPDMTKTPTAKDKEAEAGNDSSSDEATPSEDVQGGVQKIQAVTLVWSKWSLIAVLCLYVPQTPLN